MVRFYSCMIGPFAGPICFCALRGMANEVGRQAAAEWEAAHLLHARIAHLPARMQKFWRLRYEAGLTQEEVAVRLGVSRTAIRWLDSQLRKSLGAKESGVRGRPRPRSP